MTEQRLHHAQVGAIVEKMTGKGMAQHVRAHLCRSQAGGGGEALEFAGEVLAGKVTEARNNEVHVDLGHELTGIACIEAGTVWREGDTVTLCIRPEKLHLCEVGTGRLSATVTSRFFLGSQWLYRVDTAIGEVLVCSQNEGTEPVAEGAMVGIDWHRDAVRVIQEASHG